MARIALSNGGRLAYTAPRFQFPLMRDEDHD